MKRRHLETGFNVANAIDSLAEIVSRADTTVTMAERQLERCYLFRESDAELEDGERPIEHLAHLLCAAKEAARAAVVACRKIADGIVRYRETT